MLKKTSTGSQIASFRQRCDWIWGKRYPRKLRNNIAQTWHLHRVGEICHAREKLFPI